MGSKHSVDIIGMINCFGFLAVIVDCLCVAVAIQQRLEMNASTTDVPRHRPLVDGLSCSEVSSSCHNWGGL